LWTRSVAHPLPLFGERVLRRPEATYRYFEPGRAKLAAAVVRGHLEPIPLAGERWLYLGAAGGTTASYVADLVGPEGAVYAIEKSPRPFVRLLSVAERCPNLLPILTDARRPQESLGLVPPVDGLYADVAQPDQVDIVLAQAAEFLKSGGSLLLALKTASMGRDRTPEEHARRARELLRPTFGTAPPLSLDPFHRRHYLIAGRAREGAFANEPEERQGAIPRPSSGRAPGRRRFHRGLAERYAARDPR
jgi:fibrillarin-like pre-rRNA processing protein